MSKKEVPKVRTQQLLRKLYQESGVEEHDIRLVLNALGTVVGGYLRDGYIVRLDGLGELAAHKRRVTSSVSSFRTTTGKKITVRPSNIVVTFSKSRRLKEILHMSTDSEKEGMDKFAVDQTAGLTHDEQEKRAARGCPLCGKKPRVEGAVLLCPTHGTEPFE